MAHSWWQQKALKAFFALGFHCDLAPTLCAVKDDDDDDRVLLRPNTHNYLCYQVLGGFAFSTLRSIGYSLLLVILATRATLPSGSCYCVVK